MMNRTMAFVLALSLMLMLSGCDEKAEASSVSQETASSAASVSSSVPAAEETMLPLISSDNGERVYALEGSRQDNIWSTRYYWINEDRMLLFRKEDAQAERSALLFDHDTNLVRTVSNAPVELSYDNQYSTDATGIHFFMEDGVLRHYDQDLNFLGETTFLQQRNKFDCALDFQSETLYYLENGDLYQEQNGKVQLLAELPESADHSFSHALELSDDKKHLIFRTAVYEAQNTDSLLDYNLETGTLTELTDDIFDPQIGWVKGQPLIYTYSEDVERTVTSVRYGYEQTDVLQFVRFKDNVLYEESLNMDMQHGICLIYTRRWKEDPTQYRIACIREDGSYFIYHGEHARNDLICYPSLSPDQSHLSFIIAEEEILTLHLVPTEGLWQPLDWNALQQELFPKN